MNKEKFYELIDDLAFYSREYQIHLMADHEESVKDFSQKIVEIEEAIKAQLDILYDK